jgi:hypothetical protein
MRKAREGACVLWDAVSRLRRSPRDPPETKAAVILAKVGVCACVCVCVCVRVCVRVCVCVCVCACVCVGVGEDMDVEWVFGGYAKPRDQGL